MLAELRRIYQLQWINSQKLNARGKKQPYAARNGGGLTLEAELGVAPNSYAGPDFMGWEIKQYGVTDFEKFRPKSPVTLMTPEPTGGFYRDEGVAAFLHLYGYAAELTCLPSHFCSKAIGLVHIGLPVTFAWFDRWHSGCWWTSIPLFGSDAFH